MFVPAARPFGQISEQALGLLFLKYGRDDELQSDQLGARYESAANWDPAGVPGMLSTLGRLAEAAGDRKGVPNFLSTHPEPLARVTEIRPTVEKLRAGRQSWLPSTRSALTGTSIAEPCFSRWAPTSASIRCRLWPCADLLGL